MRHLFSSFGSSVVALLRWPGWRELVSRAALPMLALAASYGVYSFALLFVPQWVAITQAAAFELVYIGLAVARLTIEQQKRARYISIGAVVVSMAYNSIDGLFHRRPMLLDAPALWLDIALALLHGVPLAALAYLVADLLLHDKPQKVTVLKSIQAVSGDTPAPALALPGANGRPKVATIDDLLASFQSERKLSREALRQRLQVSDSTFDRLIADATSAGQLERVGRGMYSIASGEVTK